MATVTLICSFCETPFPGIDDPKSDTQLTCPVCGHTVPFQVAMDEAAERIEAAMAEKLKRLFDEGD